MSVLTPAIARNAPALRLRVVLALVTLAVLGSWMTSPTASAGLCKNVYGGDVISAQNLSCGKARKVVKSWGLAYKEDGVANRRVRGFRCRGDNNPYEGLTMRCRRSKSLIRFYANVP